MKLGRLITRRRAKWVGMLMSALILGLAVASVWYEAGMVKRRPSLDTYVSLDHGGVRFEAYDFNGPSESYSIFVRTDSLQIRRATFPSVQLWPTWPTKSVIELPGGAFAIKAEAFVPLWIPVLLLSVLTSYLWRADEGIFLRWFCFIRSTRSTVWRIATHQCSIWTARFTGRQRLKRAGTICACLISSVLIMSYWLAAQCLWAKSDSVVNWRVSIFKGAITVERDEIPIPPSIDFVVKSTSDDSWTQTRGTFETPRWLPSVVNDPVYFATNLPLWIPLILIVAPTALSWYADSRPKPWQCAKCRYDLRGLEGGGEGGEGTGGDKIVCPECGMLNGGET